MKVWIVFGDDVKLVDRLGSLRRAVARIGMSYRNGWGYFRDGLETATDRQFRRAFRGR